MVKPYYSTKLGRLYHGDCLEIMPELEPVDLVVTSPPYDDLRQYEGYKFDFHQTAYGLYRLLKSGGVIVWVVADATKNGSETGTSFRQALFFNAIGLNLHDTMIWNKGMFSAVGSLKTRYAPVFEYMFVLSKGSPKTFNPIKDRRSKKGGKAIYGSKRNTDGTMKRTSKHGTILSKWGQRFNVWDMPPCVSSTERTEHPAQFPQSLARDHIISWSNEGDTVFDCCAGSGTTLLQAEEYNRKWIGCEISEKYCEIIAKRLERETQQLRLF